MKKSKTIGLIVVILVVFTQVILVLAWLSNKSWDCDDVIYHPDTKDYVCEKTVSSNELQAAIGSTKD